jgi:hypothetical protein
MQTIAALRRQSIKLHRAPYPFWNTEGLEITVSEWNHPIPSAERIHQDSTYHRTVAGRLLCPTP